MRIDNHTYYSDVVKRHGMSAEGVHWNSQESQYKRFEVLLEMIEMKPDASIVDAGCGFGALYKYMQEKHITFGHYIGLEVMECMVAEASATLSCEIRLCDVLRDELPMAEYYICSGAINILSREEGLIFMKRCLDHSKKGFVFNLLEGRDDSLLYNYYLPDEILRLADTLGVHCDIKRGYLEKDFSVYFKKHQDSVVQGRL